MTLTSHKIFDGIIMAAFEVHRYDQAMSRTTLTARGTRIVTWERVTVEAIASGEVKIKGRLTLSSDGVWWDESELTSWDPTFQPISLHQVGRIETPAEYHARRRWEANTYRVGTDKSPMDNADVSADPKMPMYNYWMRG